MALLYEPGDALNFRQPFTSMTHDVLRLTNKNNSPVAFKVKTTAPKQYCVRPNAGRIEPGEAVEVQVVLQPMKEAPAANSKSRDKFLIQSIAISREMDSMTVSEIWTMAECEAKDIINEKKLRVRYLPPEEASKQQQAESNGAGSNEKSPTTSQLRANPPTRPLPGPSPLAKAVDTVVDSPGEESAADAQNYTPTKNGSASRSLTSPVATAVASSSPAAGRLFPETSTAASPSDTTGYAEEPVNDSKTSSTQQPSAETELQRANATIGNLEKQLDDYKKQLESVKLGNVGSSSPSSSSSRAVAAQSSKAVDGLSIQSVAIVALVAFMTGYFFF
ncbi:phosphatidylinositol-binding protein scs2 [Coemansia sp. IMI 203386]|nr:phosphatidylinositol-binding protein scs2 [Coemansia sp. IMI 203386]